MPGTSKLPFRLAGCAVLLGISPSAALAQTIRTAPVLSAGDSWTYETSRDVRGIRRTGHSTTSVIRVEGRRVGVENHVAGTAAPGREALTSPDWDGTRSIDGKQVVVTRPLSFPLASGRTWTLAFTETAPRDPRHSREQVALTYKAVRWEVVTVPAGTFRALRIVGDGTWRVELAPSMLPVASLTFEGGEMPVTLQPPGRPYTGRLLRIYWYVPQVRRWVRFEEETYDSNSNLSQHRTAALEAYAVAGQPPVPAGQQSGGVGAPAGPESLPE